MHKAILNIAGMFLFLLTILAATPAGAEVVVQVMSVPEAAAAEKEAARLFEMGIPAFSRAEAVPERGIWNRVFLGPFETETDAKAAAEMLKQQGTIKEYVVKKRPSSVIPQAVTDKAAEGTLAGLGAAASTSGPPAEAAPKPADPTASAAQPEGLPTYGEAGIATYDQAGAQGGLMTYGQVEANGNRAASASSSQAAAITVGGMPVNISGGSVPEAAKPEELTRGDDMPGLAPVAAAPPAPVVPELEASAPAEAVKPADQPAVAEKPAQKAKTDENAPPYRPLPEATQSFTDDPYGGEPQPQPKPKPSASLMTLAPSAGDGFGSSLESFAMLVDLSSSMRRLVPCRQRVKEEAVASLLRKMNQYVPPRSYDASLRVFGYKHALTRSDFTTLYYGPTSYNRDALGDAIDRLVAADSISPFADAIREADSELKAMNSPKAVLMFSDFEESPGSGNPVANASSARQRYSGNLKVYTFYATRQTEAIKLARNIARSGGGTAFDICRMLDDEAAFAAMMEEIFGPGQAAPCADQDSDGVCDEDDLCPNTPSGAPVDERGCWIAAYSQFFDFDKAEVKSAFLPRIKHAAELLIKNTDIPKVIIAGHTDNIGSAAYNKELGRRRAQAVYDLMVKYGVPASRMTVASYGLEHPIATNDTEEGRAKNRRVEFHIGDVPDRRGR